jgi:magnesium transporter
MASPGNVDSRQSNRRTYSGHSRPSINQELLHVHEALRQAATTTRDFEEAVVDDDKSIHGNTKVTGAGTMLGVGEQGNRGRSRRPTLVFPNADEQPNRSRAESTSSRTSSPPNSVEAFAGHRRRERAGTVNSKAPSDIEAGLHRTISGGTHKCRPTFSDGKGINQIDLDKISCQQELAEEDVCFPPPEESSKTYIIDFEALEEFVAESSKKPAAPNRCSRTHSLSSQSKLPRIFQDLRHEAQHVIPKMIATLETDSSQDVSSDDVSDEKKAALEGQSGDTIELNHCFSSLRDSPTDINRFSFFSSELESTVHAPEIGDLIIPGETFRDLFELGPDGGVWWLDMLNPNTDEVNAICKAFSIHPLTCEDIKTQEAREKVELFRQYYFVCFRSFYQMDKKTEAYMEPVNVYIVVFREGVLSFTFCQSPHASNVRKRIGRLRDYVSLSSDWICYAMM